MPYYGGKGRIGDHIGKVINKYIKSTGTGLYFEPFFGMGGVTVHIKAPKKLVCDANPSMVAMWKAVLNGKFRYPSKPISREKWGKYKFGKDTPLKGFFGVAQSFGANPYVGYTKDEARKIAQFNSTKRALKRLVPQLKNVKMCEKAGSYSNFEPKKCVVYCDPPYANTRCFAMKETAGFDSNKFWKIMDRWAKSNLVFVSEASPRKGWKTVWQMDLKTSGKLNKPRTEYLLMKGPKRLSPNSHVTNSHVTNSKRLERIKKMRK